MRRKLRALAPASIRVIDGSVAMSRPTSAGDGFARHLPQQARAQACLRQQVLSRKQASTAQSAAARTKASPGSRPSRPGVPSSCPAR
jgi:hypothetical protein